MDNEYEPFSWPPCCCVPAFVFASLDLLNHFQIQPALLAHDLDIRVGAQDFNPWNLPIAIDDNSSGLSARDAQLKIPQVLAKLESSLAFKHVPFNEIAFGMHIELFQQAASNGCVVGIGFNQTRFCDADRTLRHVARIIPTSHREIIKMIDDCAGIEKSMEWSDLEVAVADINDGFWIIGHKDSLDFELKTDTRWSYIRPEIIEVEP